MKKNPNQLKTNSVNSNNIGNNKSTLQSDEASFALALKSSGSDREQLLLKLAQKGYSKAFIPLAKYYLSNPSTHDKADKWTNKAKTQYPKEANQIINYLKTSGYYD